MNDKFNLIYNNEIKIENVINPLFIHSLIKKRNYNKI